MKVYINFYIIFNLVALVYSQEIQQISYNKFLATSINQFNTLPSGNLVIKDFKGNISIIGNGENKISVKRKTFINVFSKEKALSILEHSMKINDTEEENGRKTIFIESNIETINILNDNLEIKLPNNFSISARSNNGNLSIIFIQGKINISNRSGNIDLENLSGKFSILSSDGKVTGSQINGNVSISSENGSIQLKYLQGTLNAKTSYGDITAKNILGNITAKTYNGKIDLVNISGKKIYVQTKKGDLTAKEILGKNTIDLHVREGNISLEDLDGNLETSTLIGEISLRNIKGNTKVWNTTGNINAHYIFGSFIAKSSLGDISLSKIWGQLNNDHQIDLKTSTGNIDILLPNDFPANFTVYARDQARRSRDVIISDFPLNIKINSGISIAKGKNKNGLYKINLETNSGFIKIKSSKMLIQEKISQLH